MPKAVDQGNLLSLAFLMLTAIEKIQEQVEEQGDNVEEINLDQIRFQKFNDEINKALGK